MITDPLEYFGATVDSKKRELIGNFKNAGAKWDRSPVLVNDHDFRSDASGVGISYGIYDPPNHRGTVCVGISHDTPAFAAHSIATGWKREGSRRYGRTPKLLVLADSGGSNSCTSWAWKTEIQAQLCNAFGIAATIAHYPTGASKWNPIEHRLFSEISKNWVAEPLDSYEKMLKFIPLQGVLYLDVQAKSQLIGEISTRGTIDECFRGSQKCAETGEPNLCPRPQPVIVKTGDFAQGIVSAAMGVAGEITQRLEFPKDGNVYRGAESLFQFVQSGDLIAQQKRAQFIGAEREGPHNVIVPTTFDLLTGTITNWATVGYCLSKVHRCLSTAC
jgi:Rhodopirellula transposase DDE domain